MKKNHLPMQQQMAVFLKQLAQHEGYTLSQFDGVSFMRADRSLARTPTGTL